MASTLSQIVSRLDAVEVRGNSTADLLVNDVIHDSRCVPPGALFCAVVGEHHDGHRYAEQAVAHGACALLVERWIDSAVAQIRVPSVRRAMAHAAAEVHGDPSRQLSLVGVTGTNGKTTVAHLIEGAAAADGCGVGVIGTVGASVHGLSLPTSHTTPEAPELQRLLATMVRRGADQVVMEVSSHGLDLHRVDACDFSVAVFTNLSQDHLDWHGDMEAYFAAKARLFSPELTRHAVVWVDDDWGARLADSRVIDVTTVGTGNADVRVTGVTPLSVGAEVNLDGALGHHRLTVNLLGSFNASNAALAFVAAIAAGIDPGAAAAGIAASDGAPGRMERLDEGQEFVVLVDYAHTPDAIAHVISEARKLTDAAGCGRVIVVVGAGGDRDRGKREPMGAALADADIVLLTSDNPRHESAGDIADALAAGLRQRRDRAPIVHRQLDRRLAISEALSTAEPDDVVIIAGKGHETTQQVGDLLLPFDDRVVARTLLEEQVRP